nr:hypothetical protein [Arthrobacter sp. efr-133-TYG-120]
MHTENKTLETHAAAPEPAPEFYLPLGGGTDPDFYLPLDRVPVPGRFSRWIQDLPGFGRRLRRVLP